MIENTRPTWSTGSTIDPLIIENTCSTWSTGSTIDPLIIENIRSTWKTDSTSDPLMAEKRERTENIRPISSPGTVLLRTALKIINQTIKQDRPVRVHAYVVLKTLDGL